MQRIAFATLLVACLWFSFPALAQGTSVPIGQTETVDAHGVCQKVTNNHASGLSVFVPTDSDVEWQSFRSNPPAGVSFSSCEIVVTISASTTQVVAQSLFSAGDWSSDTPKRIVINSGVTIGSTSTSTAAFRTGTGWGGTLTIENAGSIQGAGGAAGSAGGPAFQAQAAGIIFTNTGTIYGGGGGGGTGGQGGPGSYSDTIVEGPYISISSPYFDWSTGSVGLAGPTAYVYWNSSSPIGYASSGSTPLTVGEWTYYPDGYYNGSDWKVSRSKTVTSTSTGGAGGSGGRGTGYNQSSQGGSTGTAGGTNAGIGGTGGTGGSWGSGGATGATGAAGNAGSGSAGSGGGAAGAAIANSGYVTLTNSGTILGSY